MPQSFPLRWWHLSGFPSPNAVSIYLSLVSIHAEHDVIAHVLSGRSGFTRPSEMIGTRSTEMVGPLDPEVFGGHFLNTGAEALA